ncbi:MAG TPA: hypothetical protein VEZ46_08490 [Mycobacteriales bacterium]|jgi:hypothetical protein|nr:hypothetical protein [Mycobacteriales bacterium]
MSDQLATLEDRLRRLAPHLDFAETPDLATAVGDRLRTAPAPARHGRGPALRPWADWLPRVAVAALAAVALLAVTLTVSPAARAAVRSILRRIPGIEISSDRPPPAGRTGDATPQTTTAPTTSAPATPAASATPSASPTALVVPGDRTSLAGARAAARFPIRVPAELRPPDQVYVDPSIAGRAVSFVWAAGGQLPPTSAAGVGAVLTQFEAGTETYFIKELGGSGARFDDVEVVAGEMPGAWVEGVHSVRIRALDPNDELTYVTSRLASNALVWVDDGVTYRLETAADKATALRIARSLR